MAQALLKFHVLTHIWSLAEVACLCKCLCIFMSHSGLRRCSERVISALSTVLSDGCRILRSNWAAGVDASI